MFEMLGLVAQALSAIALVFGAVFAFRYWRSTVPPGADSDCEFANHHHFNTSPAAESGRLSPQGDELNHLVIRTIKDPESEVHASQLEADTHGRN